MMPRTCRTMGFAVALALAASTPTPAPAADISLTNGGGLHFGQVVAGPSPGTVVVAPSGSRTASGGTQLGNSGGTRSAAFTVTGDADVAYDITLPSSTTLAGPSDTMEVDGFTHDATGILTGGSVTFRVGATLQVKASQASGAYAGTFQVVVTYQ